MNINREQLMKTLALVRPGLATKENIEQSTSFVFMDGRVFTYNDEIAVSHPVDFGMDGAVSATEFFNLLSKTKESELTAEVTESGLVIKGKKYKASIRLQAEITLPIDQISPPDKWNELPEDFADAVKFCLFSLGRDMTKPVLTCIHADADVVESCDGFRLTRRFFEKSAFDKPILIPGNAAKDLTSYKPTHYSVVGGWLHFKTAEDTMFSCRTFDQLEFPNLDKFISDEGGKLKFPSDMKETLDRAGIFSNSSNRDHVKIALKEGEMVVRGEGETGWFEEVCRVRYKGEPCHFFLAPQFLQTVLDINDEALVSTGSLQFESDAFIHVVSLIAGD